MQPYNQLQNSKFLIRIILHLLGDFYLQTDKLAKCKNASIDETCNTCKKCKQTNKFNFKFLLIHTLIYTIPFASLFFVSNGKVVITSIVILFASHFVIDMCTCCLNKKIKHTISFLIDQFLHIAVIYFVYQTFYNSIKVDINENIIKVVLVSLLIVLPSSVLINKLLQDVFNDCVKTGIFDVGSIIGILERVLVIVFAYYNNFAAIAIIITVKTWARSNDLKDDNFRQKYLLGTLASLVLALLSFLIYKVI